MGEPRRWLVGTRVEAYHPARLRPGGMLGPNFEPATVVEQGATGWYVECKWDDGWKGTTYHLNVRLPGEPDPVSVMK